MADAALQSPVIQPHVLDTGSMSDPNSAKRRKRRTKEEIEAEKLFKMRFKRKRGRPTREEMEQRRMMMMEAGLPVMQSVSKSPANNGFAGNEPVATDQEGGLGASPEARAKKAGRKKKEVQGPGPGVLLGKSVQGVFDGTFDAGYFLTVKVEGTDMLFRGVVFGPARAVPVTKANDIVPGVKMLVRQDIPLPPPAATPQQLPASEAATTLAVPSTGNPTTSTVSGPSL